MCHKNHFLLAEEENSKHNKDINFLRPSCYVKCYLFRADTYVKELHKPWQGIKHVEAENI